MIHEGREKKRVSKQWMDKVGGGDAEKHGGMTKRGKKYQVLSMSLRKSVFMALMPQLLSNKESFMRPACK